MSEPRNPKTSDLDMSQMMEMSQSGVPVHDPDRLNRLIKGQSRVLDVALELGIGTDLESLVAAAMEGAVEVCNATRATVYVHDAESNELYTVKALGMEAFRMPATAGLAGSCLQTKQLINIKDSWEDPRFNKKFDLATGFRTTSQLCVPMVGFSGSVVGVLQVLNKKSGIFDKDDERLARVLAAQVAVALQRQHLLEEYRAKQKMDYDLGIARDIQQFFLPDADPKVPRYEVHGWNRPADLTGGDAYDFFPLPDGKLAMTVCDATGHGIGPALVVAQCRALLRSSMVSDPTPDVVLARTNDLLCGDLPDDRFVTTFFGLLDPASDLLTWSSGGHGPMLLVNGTTGVYREYPATGVPLGIMEGAGPDAGEVVKFKRGDLFIIMTDGFIEWANPAGEQFGVDRVVNLFLDNKHTPLAEILQKLVKAVEKFGDTVPQNDDLTAIIIRRME